MIALITAFLFGFILWVEGTSAMQYGIALKYLCVNSVKAPHS